MIVEVEGRPAPKGSRIAAKTKTGKSYTYPASKYEKPWVDDVKREAQIVARHTTLVPPYRVEMEFRIHRPVNGRYPWPTGADIDKLARSTLDGLVSGKAIEDDRFVMELVASKRYVGPGEEPGVTVSVTTL